MALQPFGPWPLFQFLHLINSRQNSLDGGSACRKAATYTHNYTNRINAQTSMPRVGFKPTTPVFERAKTVHASDRAATVNGAWAVYVKAFYTWHENPQGRVIRSHLFWKEFRGFGPIVEISAISKCN
jgi:hypothetical protein